jgi:hypothetical protein
LAAATDLKEGYGHGRAWRGDQLALDSSIVDSG